MYPTCVHEINIPRPIILKARFLCQISRLQTIAMTYFCLKRKNMEKKREFIFWTSRCAKYYVRNIYISM